jgi:hypothetical protein
MVAPAFAQGPDKKPGDDANLRRWLLNLAPASMQHTSAINAVAFAPDGKSVVTVSNNAGKVYHWDAASGKLLREWGMQGNFETSAISAGGQVLAATDRSSLVSLWDGVTGKRLHILKGAAGPALALAPDGKSLVAGLEDGALGVWDVGKGQLRTRLPKSSWATGVTIAFSPDGKRIAASRPDTTIGVWDAATGKETASLPVGTADVRLVTFAPGGKGLASITGAGVAQLWNEGTGTEKRRWLMPPEHRPGCGFFSPDGRTLVTGGADGAVRILEVASGQQRHSLPALADRVVCAALSPDGRTVVTGCGDFQALVRGVSSSNRAEGQVTRAVLPKDADAAWNDLAHDDPARAYRAIEALADRVDSAALMQKHLRPAAPVEPGRIAKLIQDLDSPKFPVRQRATKELENLHEVAEGQLQAVLRDPPSLEAHQRVRNLLERMRRSGCSPERLRAYRSLEALERLATPQARAILESMAQGAAHDGLTQDARAALQRLDDKKKNQP